MERAELGHSADKLLLCVQLGPVPCAVAWRCGPLLSVIRASPREAVDKICCRAVTLACQPSHADQPLSLGSIWGKHWCWGRVLVFISLCCQGVWELHLSHGIFHSVRAEGPTSPWQEGDTETTRKSFGTFYSILAGS